MGIDRKAGFLDSDEDPIDGFECVCECGSKNVVIKDNTGCSGYTGMYGSVDLVCRECGNTAYIISF